MKRFILVTVTLVFGLLFYQNAQGQNAQGQKLPTKFIRIAKPAPRKQLASMIPFLGFDDLSSFKLVTFVACETEAECYRSLQSLDYSVEDGREDKVKFIAQYVEAPKKGVALYRKDKP